MKQSKFSTLNLVTCAMLCGLAVILARAFHHLGGMDIASLFSPMHLPILLLGVLCGPVLGMIGGALTPIISFAVSGMPPFPNSLVPMVIELALYGLFTGIMRSLLLKNPRSNNFATVISIALAMLIGRLANAVAGAVVLTITTQAPLWITLWTKFVGNFVSTWLGILLQLIIIPLIIIALQKSGVLSQYLSDCEVERFMKKPTKGNNQSS